RLGRGFARSGPGPASIGALLRHRCVEGGGIDTDAACAQRVLREIERKAVGIVETECDVAGELVTLLEITACLVEELEPAAEHFAEANLFDLQCLGDERLRALELRIGSPHLGDQRWNETVHKRIL